MLICTKAILYHWAKKTNSQASSFCFWSLMTREKRKLLWSFSFFLFLFLIENLKNPYVCCCFFDFPIILRENGTDRLSCFSHRWYRLLSFLVVSTRLLIVCRSQRALIMLTLKSPMFLFVLKLFSQDHTFLTLSLYYSSV